MKKTGFVVAADEDSAAAYFNSGIYIESMNDAAREKERRISANIPTSKLFYITFEVTEV